MTAKWAAKKGARVVMIEKRQEIGSPVRCGEGMSKDWLADVGIKPGRWINLEVEGARIYAPNEKCLEINEKHAGNEVGFVVERDGFESQVGRWAGRPTNIATRDMDTCLQYRMTNVD
ncbi:MAG TPA: NAD(P)/FAD-dependent oxidoreductase, partial [Thermoplasmata archaeon]|nr:NAD(P)/FAD-dependent oxidoreductase [Thermoplasmata archaeon]